jgi:hypothetical protein
LAHLYPGEGELNVCCHRIDATPFAAAATLAAPDEPGTVILEARPDDYALLVLFMDGRPTERVLREKQGVALTAEGDRPRSAQTERLMVALMRIAFDGNVVQHGVAPEFLLKRTAWLDELEQDAAKGRPLPESPDAAYVQLGGDARRKPAVILRLMRRTFVLYQRPGHPLMTLECASLPHAVVVWLLLTPRAVIPLEAIPVPFRLIIGPAGRQ